MMSNARRAGILFGLAFVLSALFIAGGQIADALSGEQALGGESGPGWQLVGTLITLAGFVSTTMLNWRAERRASERHELEIRRLSVELEALNARANATGAGA